MLMEGKPRESLVLYDNPIEVSTIQSPNEVTRVRVPFRSLPVSILSSRSEDSLEVSKFPTQLTFLNSNRVTVSAVSVGSKKGPIIESKPSQESILNAILPPREWVENGKQYVQYVSHQQASRVDVARLREQLDQKLMERQARESGICPVREELFSQCFDEIIR